MNEDYDKHRILHHLDDPLRFLSWTIDEACALFVPFFFGVGLGQPLVGCLVSVASYWFLGKIKKRFGLHALKYAFYWYLPLNRKKLPCSPSSFIREYTA